MNAVTTDKEDLIDMEEPNLINGFGDFSDAVMTAFVQAMNAAGETVISVATAPVRNRHAAAAISFVRFSVRVFDTQPLAAE